MFNFEKHDYPVFFQLTETEDNSEKTEPEYRKVYSVLALRTNGDETEHRFVYDVSRNKETASRILSEIRRAEPEIGELDEFISELL